MRIALPNLLNYRDDYRAAGIPWPLKAVAYDRDGLLQSLPVDPGKRKGWAWDEQTDPALYKSKKAWPKITIVTPSYNQAAFLEQTIRSVLLQNYPNLEYIVIDGGSTDGSAEIIKKYSPWLSFWESREDRGQGHAINKGFSLASGDYFAWINSDDHYLPQTFYKVISRFTKTNAAFVYGYALNLVLENNCFAPPSTMNPLMDYFLRIPALAQPACFWRAAVHQPIWEALHCSLDYELWLRLVRGNKRELIREPLAVALIHQNAKTSDAKMKAKWEEDHNLICGDNAHGPVADWDTRVLLYRIRNKIYKWLRRV